MRRPCAWPGQEGLSWSVCSTEERGHLVWAPKQQDQSDGAGTVVGIVTLVAPSQRSLVSGHCGPGGYDSNGKTARTVWLHPPA